jgi:hypothetical protein
MDISRFLETAERLSVQKDTFYDVTNGCNEYLKQSRESNRIISKVMVIEKDIERGPTKIEK